MKTNYQPGGNPATATVSILLKTCINDANYLKATLQAGSRTQRAALSLSEKLGWALAMDLKREQAKKEFPSVQQPSPTK